MDRPVQSEVVGTYQNQADAHLTYTLLDKITEDNAYHYDATHRVTEEGLAQDGEFHASDERHFEHVNTLRRVYESEVYNMGSSFSDSYVLNLGYGYKDTIGPAFTNGVTNTTIDSLVTEDGHYRDAGVNSNGQPVRTSDGHADSTTTTRTATLNFEYSYFDTDPETYLIQPPEELPQTNWEHEIKETENLAVDSRTVVSAFTLDYGSGGGNRKPSDSISTNDDSNNWMHVWTQGYDAATDALGPEMEGDKTETHHLDASFPAAGQASGWAEGHVWGWQTDANNDQLGDVSWVSGFPADLEFDYDDPAGYDPINNPPPPPEPVVIPQPVEPPGVWEAFALGFGFGGTEVVNVALKTVTFGTVNLDAQAAKLADAAYLDENTIRLTRLAANVGVTAAFAAATPSALARLGTVPGVSRIVASPVGQLIGRGLASRPVQGEFW